MRVKQGWSGEVEPNVWAKITVELDEDDLRRMLREHNIETPAEQVPLATAYALLEVEAERLVLMKLLVRHGYPQQQGTEELAGFEAGKVDLLGTLVPA